VFLAATTPEAAGILPDLLGNVTAVRQKQAHRAAYIMPL
tara:strand:- start:3772 stop:3888 length:117 start_codon:yes stop_codon:yes gene_type:complete